MNTATTRSSEIGKAVNISKASRVHIPALLKQRMIAEMTYLIAKNRGYVPGYELRDWFEAERLIREQYPDE
ncbi:MAG TPA: DUF2934 domain-containing protein [Novimethylophilus sp.]|jgi:hypothetical protein|uniref:DUF2934 domain-containing protein n=1 Tax=Novimethylophilus sp. TaxID=2137426 RepID=UPI002F41D102